MGPMGPMGPGGPKIINLRNPRTIRNEPSVGLPDRQTLTYCAGWGHGGGAAVGPAGTAPPQQKNKKQQERNKSYHYGGIFIRNIEHLIKPALCPHKYMQKQNNKRIKTTSRGFARPAVNSYEYFALY